MSSEKKAKETSVINAVEFLENANKKDYEAYESLPYKFDKCTYEQPEVCRQIVYSCLDCENIGICYSCSIACDHYNHRLIDINYKKNFTCDCGTEKDVRVGKCKLITGSGTKEHNEDNKYGHNFNGKYCYCNKKYEADAPMVQCQLGSVCNEDWYHLKCIDLESNNVSEDDFDDFVCSMCFKEYSDLFEKVFEKYKDENWFIKIKVNKTEEALLLKHNYSTVLQRILLKEKQEDSVSDLSKFLGVLIYKDLVNPYSYYEPPKDTFESLIKVDDENYIKDEDFYSKRETDILVGGMEGKALDLEKFHDFKNDLKTFLTGFAMRKDVIKKEDIDTFFGSLGASKLGKRTYSDLNSGCGDLNASDSDSPAKEEEEELEEDD